MRVSTSASSSLPTFPSTAAALRFRPRNFARFIGDSLNARLNSSCVIDMRGTDLPRLVKALHTLIGWSVARPSQLAVRADEGRSDVISFGLVGTEVVFWSAQVTRGAGPRLEIYPRRRRRGSESCVIVSRQQPI